MAKRRSRITGRTRRSRGPDRSPGRSRPPKPRAAPSRARRKPDDFFPSFAWVICTRNRPEALRTTLESVWRQSRLPQELIVIDDGQLPRAQRQEIARRCRDAGIAFRCEHPPTPGLTASRNHAARLAACEVLFYADDDATYDPDCLLHLAGILRDPRICAAAGTIEEAAFRSPSARLFQWGYVLAGWWRVRPRGRPPGPAPRVLLRPDIAAPARWLPGGAMAVRRRVVLENPFDESLSGAALGEDREFTYRLAPRHWLVQSRLARVIHRREPLQRNDAFQFGMMAGRNYVTILRKTCRLGVGDRLLIGWSFLVLSLMHLAWSVGPGRRAHLQTLWGLIAGLRQCAPWGRILRARPASRTAEADRAFPLIRPSARYVRNRRGTGKTAAKQPIRALFVTNRLEPGGAERMLVNLAKALSQNAVKPIVACLQDAGPLAAELSDSGVNVVDRLLGNKYDPTALSRLIRLIHRENIDVIVAAHSGGDRMFWSTLAGRWAGVPIVVWSHWFPHPGDRHFEFANRALYRLVDAYVALGERHRRALARHAYVPAGRIVVIPNALDPTVFAGVSADRRRLARRKLGLKGGEVAVAIIANLRPEKRHDVFVEAARRLAGKRKGLRFLIIGDGPSREHVSRIVAAAGLKHGLLRMLGARDDVPDLLPGIDIIALSSEQECFSVVMLEAAAAGCAFIGPNTGAIPEFVDHGRSGLLIPPADPDALAEAVGRLASRPALRKRLTAAAQRRLLKRHTMDRMTGAFKDLFVRITHGDAIVSEFV